MTNSSVHTAKNTNTLPIILNSLKVMRITTCHTKQPVNIQQSHSFHSHSTCDWIASVCNTGIPYSCIICSKVSIIPLLITQHKHLFIMNILSFILSQQHYFTFFLNSNTYGFISHKLSDHHLPLMSYMQNIIINTLCKYNKRSHCSENFMLDTIHLQNDVACVARFMYVHCAHTFHRCCIIPAVWLGAKNVFHLNTKEDNT